MTLVPCDTNRTRVLSRSGHCKTGDFAFSASRSVFQRKTLRQDRVRATIGNSVDLEHSPVWSCFVMTTERVSSRVVDHRLDEPRQIIPQHGLPPRSARFCCSSLIRSPLLTKEHSLHFRLRQDTAC
jgi:hypothetical protein